MVRASSGVGSDPPDNYCTRNHFARSSGGDRPPVSAPGDANE
jgi:hypothetical protein